MEHEVAERISGLESWRDIHDTRSEERWKEAWAKSKQARDDIDCHEEQLQTIRLRHAEIAGSLRVIKYEIGILVTILIALAIDFLTRH